MLVDSNLISVSLSSSRADSPSIPTSNKKCFTFRSVTQERWRGIGPYPRDNDAMITLSEAPGSATVARQNAALRLATTWKRTFEDHPRPSSRVCYAHAARHHHVTSEKSLTSGLRRHICQASMSEVRGEVFDYTEASSRNIGLLSKAEQEPEGRGDRRDGPALRAAIQKPDR